MWFVRAIERTLHHWEQWTQHEWDSLFSSISLVVLLLLLFEYEAVNMSLLVPATNTTLCHHKWWSFNWKHVMYYSVIFKWLFVWLQIYLYKCLEFSHLFFLSHFYLVAHWKLRCIIVVVAAIFIKTKSTKTQKCRIVCRFIVDYTLHIYEMCFVWCSASHCHTVVHVQWWNWSHRFQMQWACARAPCIILYTYTCHSVAMLGEGDDCKIIAFTKSSRSKATRIKETPFLGSKYHCNLYRIIHCLFVVVSMPFFVYISFFVFWCHFKPTNKLKVPMRVSKRSVRICGVVCSFL